jgi:hypothetical protein
MRPGDVPRSRANDMAALGDIFLPVQPVKSTRILA